MANSNQKNPAPPQAAPRSAKAFLGEKERPFARRDFLARSSVAGLIVAAGGIFCADVAEASVPSSPEPSATDLARAHTLAQKPEARPAAPNGVDGGVLLAQHCSHASHASHGSHGSHGSW